MIGEVYTALGTPNIALIKYWGKRDEKLILPKNSSISLTLDDSLNTKTSVVFSDKLKEDTFYINGEQQNLLGKNANERLGVINILREKAGVKTHFLVVSNNSFPTASGLASSASGIAALVFATSQALDLNLNHEELSTIARMGSGSACRSLFGGFVRWNMGEKNDGSDSFAEQIVSNDHWPEIVDIIAVVTEEKKKVSSRAGMQQTVENGILYAGRIDYVENAVEELARAIREKDFETLALITMRDSNNMHATMLDTWPPIFYMNDVSRSIVYKIHDLNLGEGRNIAAYTFDAGPNAHIITTDSNKAKVLEILNDIEGIKIIEAKAGTGPKLIKNHSIEEQGLTPVGV
jgi:diphosphomevalonate decarboxylase